VLVECLGLPLLEFVRRAVAPLRARREILVVGHREEAVRAWLAEAGWSPAVVVQSPRLGTGHAVRTALEAHPDLDGDLVVVSGDVPQVLGEDLDRLLAAHRSERADATVVTGVASDAGSLGRIVRDGAGRFLSIVEARDAAGRPDLLSIGEFNTGIYAFRVGPLRDVLPRVGRDNAQGEEYLTDALGRLAADGRTVSTVVAEDPLSLLGVNDLDDLARCTSVIRRRIATAHLRAGVAIVDPDTTVLEADVEIGPGTRILPFTHVARGCRIGRDCVVGPFARLRGGTVLEDGAEVGNFVEAKAARFGRGAKAKHLAYLGDAEVGPGANVGCGAITANYDGRRKHRTVIGPGARIGSGTVLVAPVTVGEGAVTGANAVVIRDVPPGVTAVGVPARHLSPKGERPPKGEGHDQP
jgi:bifunctional UDP-N-acetylglucosamine pyrophosphorylase/glucosamine-1-phosphate N-acetyltransferase